MWVFISSKKMFLLWSKKWKFKKWCRTITETYNTKRNNYTILHKIVDANVSDCVCQPVSLSFDLLHSAQLQLQPHGWLSEGVRERFREERNSRLHGEEFLEALLQPPL